MSKGPPPPPQVVSRYNLSMSRNVQEILEDARQLPLNEVNWLIESLLLEGDGAPQAEIEAAWDGEIKRRLAEIDSGAVELTGGMNSQDSIRRIFTARSTQYSTGIRFPLSTGNFCMRFKL